MGFWSVYFGIYGGGGIVVTEPCDGWLFPPANRISVLTSQQRVSVCSPNHRVWIARQGNE